jgi:hypothetical protein
VQLVLQNEDFLGHLNYLIAKENGRLSLFCPPESDFEGRVTKGIRINLAISSADHMVKNF